MSKFRWNSETIKKDLERFPYVSAVNIGNPGGDVDTQRLEVTVINGGDTLYVCGFSTDEDFWKLPDKGDVDVEFIELMDGRDGRGGLTSNDPNTALAYVTVRDYFNRQGVEVVPSMEEYF